MNTDCSIQNAVQSQWFQSERGGSVCCSLVYLLWVRRLGERKKTFYWLGLIVRTEITALRTTAIKCTLQFANPVYNLLLVCDMSSCLRGLSDCTLNIGAVAGKFCCVFKDKCA